MSKVTVVIPTLDREEYLREAVESVIAQSYENLELVVVDGGSSDSTLDYLEKLDFAEKKIVEQSGEGVGNARNEGVEHAEGDLILFLDDDDRLFQETVDRMVDKIQGLSEDYAGVYTGERYFGESEGVKRIDQEDAEELIDASFGTSCSLFRRKVIEDLGGFDENMDASEDLEFIIRLFHENYRLAAIPEPLYERRIHEEQLTREYMNVIDANHYILKKHGEKMSPLEIFERYKKIASLYIKMGNGSKAIEAVEESGKIPEKYFDDLDSEIKHLYLKRSSDLFKKLDYNEKADEMLSRLVETVDTGTNLDRPKYLIYRRVGLKFIENDSPEKARMCFRKAVRENRFDRFSYYFYFWCLFGRKGYKTGRRIESSLKRIGLFNSSE